MCYDSLPRPSLYHPQPLAPKAGDYEDNALEHENQTLQEVGRGEEEAKTGDGRAGHFALAI